MIFPGLFDRVWHRRVGREQDGRGYQGQGGGEAAAQLQRQNVRKNSEQTFCCHFLVAQCIRKTVEASSGICMK